MTGLDALGAGLVLGALGLLAVRSRWLGAAATRSANVMHAAGALWLLAVAVWRGPLGALAKDAGFELRDPLLLLLLTPVAVIAARQGARGAAPAPALALPDLARLMTAPTLRTRALGALPWARALALTLVVFACARPRLGEEQSIVKREGIAIQLVLDRSSSMEAEMRYGERRLPRIEVVKQIFRAFVKGEDGLRGRPTDLIGLTTFARFPEENCPLVSLHEPLLSAVRNLKTVPEYLTAQLTPTRDRSEARHGNPLNRTGIGSALYRAVLALVAAEDDLERQRKREFGEDAFRIRGKVCVLLTDGENNTGMDPLEAAEIAAKNDVKVYTVLLADREDYGQTRFGQRVTRERSDEELDAMLEVPRAVAEKTGARAFLATDGDELAEIYAEIDQLERTELGTIIYASYQELFPWPLGAAFALLALLGALEATWLRRAP